MLSLQALKLLQHRSLGVDLLELGVLELFASSQSHFQILDSAHFLLQAANLLRIRVLGCVRSTVGGQSLIRVLFTSVRRALATVGVAARTAVSVTAATSIGASGAAAVVSVVATAGSVTSLGASSIAARTHAKVARWWRKACTASCLALRSALARALLAASLLVLVLLSIVTNRLS